MPLALRLILAPLYPGWWFIATLKRWLYSASILSAYQSSLPTVVVGNLSMGGTGKTPFSISLMDRLTDRGMKVAYLSRGYGRSTTGLKVVEQLAKASEVGDEPTLVKMRFPNADVVVCENRREGLEYIEQFTEAQVVVMDDAFQHMRVKASLYCLLTTYEKPFFKDFVFPVGMLRESRRFANRADYAVVTKCPDIMDDTLKSEFKDNVKSYYTGAVLFSQVNYDVEINSVFGAVTLPVSKITEVLAFAGTASNEGFFEQIAKQSQLLEKQSFSDHHNYSTNDIERIIHRFEGLKGGASTDLIILTTEKDAARLRTKAYEQQFGSIPLFYWPINAGFDSNSEQGLNKIVDQLC